MTTDIEWLKFLLDDHKIKKEILEKRGIIFDANTLKIPYYSPSGELLYEKKRKEPNYTGSNKYLYPPGSTVVLYPHDVLPAHKEIVLTEGELDALTLESFDISAVTSGGTTSFRPELTSYFKDKKVYVCFDCDEAGKKGAKRTAQILVAKGVGTKIIELPQMDNGKDIGDFFRLGHTKEEFVELIKNARTVEAESSETKTPTSIVKQQLLTQELSYKEVEAKVTELLPGTQKALQVVLAVAVSSQFQFPAMLWLLLVDSPSSAKTDFVKFTRDAHVTYFLDSLTLNSFISGERSTRSQKTYDLLPQLNMKCFVVKDWTAIFSQDERATKKVLGDLVNAYDKEFAKFSARRGNISYESYFSHLGCVTPATLNRHTNYMNMIGPRFLCFNMPETTIEAEKLSRALIFSERDRSLLEKETRLYVSSYLQQLTNNIADIKSLQKISSEAEEYLWIAAKLVAHCRGIVITQANSFQNESGETVKYYDVLDVQIEKHWRALHQLIALTKSLAFVTQHEAVGAEELEIIKDVVLASMPADRSRALKFIQSHTGELTAKELADMSEGSYKTSQRLLKELTGLGVLTETKGLGTIATSYAIKTEFKDFICLNTAEFLSTYSSGTETPDSDVIEISTPLSDQEKILIQKETELSELLNTLDKNSPEYEKTYHEKFALREKGIQLGLFTGTIPVIHEPWMDRKESNNL